MLAHYKVEIGPYCPRMTLTHFLKRFNFKKHKQIGGPIRAELTEWVGVLTLSADIFHVSIKIPLAWQDLEPEARRGGAVLPPCTAPLWIQL